MNSTYQNLEEAFNNTLKNCKFYEKEQKEWSLANEIGVLRGLMYVIEMTGGEYITEETMHFIDIQNKLKTRDGK